MMGAQSHHHLPRDVSFLYMLHHPLQLLLPMTLGAIPMGLAAGVITYFPARYLVDKYQHRRHHRRVHRRSLEQRDMSERKEPQE
jgi:uncharacterized protein (DUF2062 family)